MPVREVVKRRRKTPLQSITFSITVTASPRECRALLDLEILSRIEPRSLATWAEGIVRAELAQMVEDAKDAGKDDGGYA